MPSVKRATCIHVPWFLGSHKPSQASPWNLRQHCLRGQPVGCAQVQCHAVPRFCALTLTCTDMWHLNLNGTCHLSQLPAFLSWYLRHFPGRIEQLKVWWKERRIWNSVFCKKLPRCTLKTIQAAVPSEARTAYEYLRMDLSIDEIPNWFKLHTTTTNGSKKM